MSVATMCSDPVKPLTMEEVENTIKLLEEKKETKQNVLEMIATLADLIDCNLIEMNFGIKMYQIVPRLPEYCNEKKKDE